MSLGCRGLRRLWGLSGTCRVCWRLRDLCGRIHVARSPQNDFRREDFGCSKHPIAADVRTVLILEVFLVALIDVPNLNDPEIRRDRDSKVRRLNTQS
jgi:hypothetical protein